MVLTKEELLGSLHGEIGLLLHLISKVDPSKLDYSPLEKQRTTLDLLRYIALMGPIHTRGVLAEGFDMGVWRDMWMTGKARTENMNLEEVTAEISAQPALFTELLSPLTDADLRMEKEMFGRKASRGVFLVSLVLNHYAAYRMQLFQYLKVSVNPELNTMNLWAGRDNW